MKKDDFLYYLYQNNYNNVFEHALNVCNRWGLGYAISSIGEHIPTQNNPTRTMFDLWEEKESPTSPLNFNINNTNILIFTVPAGTYQDGTSLVQTALGYNVLIPPQEYFIVKYRPRYWEKIGDTWTEEWLINDKANTSLVLLNDFDIVGLENLNINGLTKEIIIKENPFNFCIGIEQGGYYNGIVMPYYNYYCDWSIPNTTSGDEGIIQLYNKFYDTKYSFGGMDFITSYLLCYDLNKNKLYTAVTYMNTLFTGTTIEPKANLDSNIMTSNISFFGEFISDGNNLRHGFEFIENLTPAEKNWLKTITI